VKVIGQLTFQRTHPVNDSTTQALNGTGFLPNISFQVYSLKDSAYCIRKSESIKMVSSCSMPDTGGDMIIFGDFIFLNRMTCVWCKRPDNRVDYCRPIIENIFKNLDKSAAHSLEQLVGQFPIKGQTLKLPF